MWVRMASAGTTSWDEASEGASQALTAPEFQLVDADRVVEAGCHDSSTVVQMSAQFERGLNSSDPSPAAFELAEALSLVTEDQVMAFLELYGRWLGGGWLDGTKAAVSFGPVSENDQPYLDGLLARIPLSCSQSATPRALGYWTADSNGQLQYHIVDPVWWQLFDGQYGGKHEGDDASAAKWLCQWVWKRSKEQLRALISGLAMADGVSAGAGLRDGSIRTSSVRFRDEVVRMLLHAGYSCTIAKDEQRQTTAADGRTVLQMHSAWKVDFTEHPTAAQPKLSVASEVARLPTPWRGVVWCVTVPTSEHLIMVRRVLEREEGVVVRASRPVVVGNSDTPKYGLIYHASLVGQAAPKLKGKVSRMLAAKTALCIRMDALGETEGVSIGLEGREKVEARLKVLESGGASAGGSGKPSAAPKKPDQSAYLRPSSIKHYNADADVSMDTNGAASSSPSSASPSTDAKAVKAEATNGAVNGEKKKEKKDKKRKVEEVTAAHVAAPAEEEEEVKEEAEEAPKPKKSKKDRSKK